jgi:hypothetical protein
MTRHWLPWIGLPRCKYTPTSKMLDAEGLTDMFLKKNISRLGTPSSIVSDRGSIFTSDFLETTIAPSRSEGQDEYCVLPSNQWLKSIKTRFLSTILRSFVDYQQVDWASLLPVAESTYNNPTHASTPSHTLLLVDGLSLQGSV